MESLVSADGWIYSLGLVGNILKKKNWKKKSNVYDCVLVILNNAKGKKDIIGLISKKSAPVEDWTVTGCIHPRDLYPRWWEILCEILANWIMRLPSKCKTCQRVVKIFLPTVGLHFLQRATRAIDHSRVNRFI